MKKLLGIFMAAVTVIAACVGFAGCKETESRPAGTTYLLRLAYNEGFITKEDLEQIANHINRGVEPKEELDPQIEQAIKETLAYEMRRDHPDINNVTADDFYITRYCGEYHGCYAFVGSNGYLCAPAVMPEGAFYYDIAGVHFNISTTGIYIWRANQ